MYAFGCSCSSNIQPQQRDGRLQLILDAFDLSMINASKSGIPSDAFVTDAGNRCRGIALVEVHAR